LSLLLLVLIELRKKKYKPTQGALKEAGKNSFVKKLNN
jgi:hypothetical protein